MNVVARCCRLSVFFAVFCGIGFSVSVIPIAVAEEKDAATGELFFLDLQPAANFLRTQALHGFPGNDFSELPAGEQVFAERKFHIRDGYSLGSKIELRKPRLIEGIAVNQKLRALYFLHGTGFGAYGAPGGQMYVEDGTHIGEYRVNYADGTTEKVPIVYGSDVRDWWSREKDFHVTRGKLAWEGQNPYSREESEKIRLYLATWRNPHPDRLILSVDYASTETSAAAPFCLAITGEGE
jgi:hypothetical protein